MEFKDVIQQRRAVNFFDPTQDVTDAQLKQITKLRRWRLRVSISNPGGLSF